MSHFQVLYECCISHMSCVGWTMATLVQMKFGCRTCSRSPNTHTHMFACTQIHTHVCVHIHTHVRAHSHTCARTISHVCTHTCSHTCACAHTHVCTYTHALTHVHVCTRTYNHTLACVHIIHVCMHTPTYKIDKLGSCSYGSCTPGKASSPGRRFRDFLVHKNW